MSAACTIPSEAHSAGSPARSYSSMRISKVHLPLRWSNVGAGCVEARGVFVVSDGEDVAGWDVGSRRRGR